jgi:hypothetical protein
VRRAYRSKTPEGAANSSYVHFLFGLIFKYQAIKGIGLTTWLARVDDPNPAMGYHGSLTTHEIGGFVTPLGPLTVVLLVLLLR